MANSSYRAAMRRRVISKAFDRLLDDIEQVNRDVSDLSDCRHLGEPCDYWGVCSHMSLSYSQREYRGRQA